MAVQGHEVNVSKILKDWVLFHIILSALQMIPVMEESTCRESSTSITSLKKKITVQLLHIVSTLNPTYPDRSSERCGECLFPFSSVSIKYWTVMNFLIKASFDLYFNKIYLLWQRDVGNPWYNCPPMLLGISHYACSWVFVTAVHLWQLIKCFSV